VIAGNYVKLLRSPDVPRLIVAFVALGVATTMTPLAFVLFAHSATHSFATASLVLAASTAGSLLAGPARGRLIDRAGPRRAVLVLAVPDILTDAAFIVAGQAGVSAAVLVLLGFVAGAVAAPALTALRSVWSETVEDADRRQAAYGLMSMMVETTYIVGPLLTGALVAAWSAAAAIAVSAVLSFVGTLTFATADQARRPPHARHTATRLSAIAGPGMRTLLATSAAFGVTFGVLDVAFPAFARAHGSTAAAGVLLSAFAVGSLIGAFAYGLRPRNRPAAELYPALCLLGAIGFAPLILLPGLAVMTALAILSGLCFAPVATCQLAAVDEVADPARRAEAFTWFSTAYGAGLAVGAALCGQLLAASGIRAALVTACGAALVAAIVAAVQNPSRRGRART
jgi:predicted MFS family arabinose efflux permease